MQDVKFVIITGLSGAGKTETIRSFEDLGYFCVDNLPPKLIPKFAELCIHSHGKINRVALVIDIRGGEFFQWVFESLNKLEKMRVSYCIVFLEASDEILVQRFKETRRRHPLVSGGAVLEGIRAEREILQELRGRASRIIDTSDSTSQQLKREILKQFTEKNEKESMMITVVSFGFKHGVPIDADLVFDVRFLPNPHYVNSLRAYTGKDPQVNKYVFKWPVTQRFMDKLIDMLSFMMPQFVKEGRAHLMIGIGCTGGKHRSVAIAEVIGSFLKEKEYNVVIEHRDIQEEKVAEVDE